MLLTKIDFNEYVVKFQGRAYWFQGINAKRDAEEFMYNIENKMLYI